MSSYICRPKPLVVEEENQSVGEYTRTSICKMGSGAAGHVISVEHRRTNTRYALKCVPLDRAQEVDQLYNEAMILQHVHHPHIIKMFQLLQTNRGIYLVLELLKHNLNQFINEHNAKEKEQKEKEKQQLMENEGASPLMDHSHHHHRNSMSRFDFDENTSNTIGGNTTRRTRSSSRLTRNNRNNNGGDSDDNNNNNNNNASPASSGLPDSIARRLFQQITAAVHCVHSHHISHNDIRCENIVIDHQGNARLIDFGRAIMFDPETNDILHFAGGMSDDSLSLNGVHHTVNATLKEHPLWHHQHHHSSSNLASAAHSVRGGGHPYKPAGHNKHNSSSQQQNDDSSNNTNNTNTTKEKLPVKEKLPITASNLQQHQKGLKKENTTNITVSTTKAAFGRNQSIDQLSTAAESSHAGGNNNQQHHRDPFSSGLSDKANNNQNNNNNAEAIANNKNNNTSTTSVKDNNQITPVTVNSTSSAKNGAGGATPSSNFGGTAPPTSGPTPTNNNNNGGAAAGAATSVSGGAAVGKNDPNSLTAADTKSNNSGTIPFSSLTHNRKGSLSINTGVNNNNNNANATKTSSVSGSPASVFASTHNTNHNGNTGGAAVGTNVGQNNNNNNHHHNNSTNNGSNPTLLSGGMAESASIANTAQVSRSPDHMEEIDLFSDAAQRDVFDLGVVLYVILTGENPFGEYEDAEEVVSRPDFGHLIQSGAARQLVKGMINFDPTKQYTLGDVCHHPWFAVDLSVEKEKQLFPDDVNGLPRASGMVDYHLEFADQLSQTNFEKSSPIRRNNSMIALPTSHSEVFYTSQNNNTSQYHEPMGTHTNNNALGQPVQMGHRGNTNSTIATHDHAGTGNNNNNHNHPSLPRSGSMLNVFTTHDFTHNNNNTGATGTTMEDVGNVVSTSNPNFHQNNNNNNPNASYTSTPRDRALSVAHAGLRGFLDFSHNKQHNNNNNNHNQNDLDSGNGNNNHDPHSFSTGTLACATSQSNVIHPYYGNNNNNSAGPLFSVMADELETSQNYGDRKHSLSHQNMMLHNQFHASQSLNAGGANASSTVENLLAANNNSTEEERSVIQNIFQSIDLDSNGVLSMDQIRDVIIALKRGEQVSKSDVEGIYNELLSPSKRSHKTSFENYSTSAAATDQASGIVAPSSAKGVQNNNHHANTGSGTSGGGELSLSPERQPSQTSTDFLSHQNHNSIQQNQQNQHYSQPNLQHNNNNTQQHNSVSSFKQTTTKEFHGKQQNNNTTPSSHTMNPAAFTNTNTHEPDSAISSPTRSDRHHSTSFNRNGRSYYNNNNGNGNDNDGGNSPIPSQQHNQQQFDGNNNNMQHEALLTYRQFLDYWVLRDGDHDEVIAGLIGPNTFTLRRLQELGSGGNGDSGESNGDDGSGNNNNKNGNNNNNAGTCGMIPSASTTNVMSLTTTMNNASMSTTGQTQTGGARSLAELAATFSPSRDPADVQRLRKAFDILDKDHSGTFNQEDLREVLEIAAAAHEKMRREGILPHVNSLSSNVASPAVENSSSNIPGGASKNQNSPPSGMTMNNNAYLFDAELLGEDDIARLAEALASRFHNKNICFFDFVAAILDDEVLTNNVLGGALSSALGLGKIEGDHADQAIQRAAGVTLFGTPGEIMEHFNKCPHLRVVPASEYSSFSVTQTPMTGHLVPSASQGMISPGSPSFASPVGMKALPSFSKSAAAGGGKDLHHHNSSQQQIESLNNTASGGGNTGSNLTTPAGAHLVSPAGQVPPMFPNSSSNANIYKDHQYSNSAASGTFSNAAVANSPTEVKIIIRYSKHGFPQLPLAPPSVPTSVPPSVSNGTFDPDLAAATTSAGASPVPQPLPPPPSTHTAPSFSQYLEKNLPNTPSTTLPEGPSPTFPVTHANGRQHGMTPANGSLHASFRAGGGKSKLSALKAKSNIDNASEGSPVGGIPAGMIDLKVVLRQADCRMMTTIQIRPMPGSAANTYYNSHKDLWKEAVTYIRNCVAEMKLEALKMSRPAGDSEWI